MTTVLELWSNYAACWSAPATGRADTLSRWAAPDVTYRDPGTEVRGVEALSGYMTGFGTAFPGHRFEITSVDAHHDRSLARWRQLDPDGRPVASGIRAASHTDDGRLLDIAGYFPIT
jgi:hypothetical protein